MNHSNLIRKVDFHNALIQGVYWISYSALYSFITVYLLYHGFSNLEVGIIIALSQGIIVIGSPALSSLIDRSKRLTNRLALIILIFATLACLLGLGLFPDCHLLTAVLYTVVSALLYMMIPCSNAMVMEFDVRGLPINYGLGRGIGSAGYAIASVILGNCIEANSADVTIPISAVCFLAFLGVTIAFRYRIPPDMAAATPSGSTFKGAADEKPLSNGQILKKYPVFLFLMIGFTLVSAAHCANNTYINHISANANIGESGMGIALAISGFAEIPIMFLFTPMRRKFGTWALMRVSVIAYFLRSLLYLFASSAWMVYLASILGGLEYGLMTPVLVYFVAHYLRPADLAKGQAFPTICSCLGFMFSSVICGRLLDVLGLHSMLLCNTFVSAVGTGIILAVSICSAKQEV